MAETIILRVELQGEETVLASLNQIDSIASALANKPIALNISGNVRNITSELQNAAKQAENFGNAVGNAASPSVSNSYGKLAKTTFNYSGDMQRLLQTTREYNAAAGHTTKVVTDNITGQIKSTTVVENGAKALKAQEKAAKEAQFGYKTLGDSVGHIALKMGVWQVMGNVISGTINSVKEAVGTIKEVDTELTNIQKVTDLTNDQIKELGDSAYSTASKYGVSANEFLEAAGNFAKAGYDNFDALAELAIKTQLVGDVTAQTASKFLLSADAAFKFRGNVDQLSTVLDKANVIENNYATSIDKIADGFPIVASTAALANMSIDETMAALGTITAVTQETGTKAATALRALILNILGDTTTEVEDGVTVTTEQIKNLSDALAKYAPEAVEAARATGKVKDPMIALASLSKAFQEGALSEAELVEILSDVGGKLRTNELASLVKNWGIFEKMLGETETAAGSADKEVETMLSSWEAKTNILKNSWTEFLSTFIDTDFVKGALDAGTGVLNWLTDLIKPGGDPYAEQLSELEQLKARSEELTLSEQRRLTYLEAQEESLKAQEQARKQEEFDTFQAHNNQDGEGIGAVTNRQSAKAIADATREFQNTWDIDAYRASLQDVVNTYGDLATQVQAYKDAGFADQLTAEQLQFLDNYNAVLDVLANFDEFTQKMAESAKDTGAEETAEGLDRVAESAGEVPEEVTVETEAEGTESSVKDLNSVRDAAGEVPTSINISVSVSGAEEAKAALSGLGHRFAEGTNNAPAGPAMVNEEGPEIISDNGRAFIANGGKPAIVNLHQGATVIPADETRSIIKNSWRGSSIPAFKNGGTYIFGFVSSSGASHTTTASGLQNFTSTSGANHSTSGGTFTPIETSEPAAPLSDQELINATLGALLTNNVTPEPIHGMTFDGPDVPIVNRKKGGGGNDGKGVHQWTWEETYGEGGSGEAQIDFEALQDELDDALDLLDAQIRLAENQGNMEKVLELQDEAQNRIAELLDKYREAGYEDTSKVILDLANKGYGYANDQLDVQEDLWEALIDSLNDLYRSTEESNDLEEKRLAVEKARETLENTRNQRNVRIFNPVTGQWEWVANAADIQNAQERLEGAEKALQKEQIAQELDALEKAQGTDLGNVVLGPGLSALLNNADEEDTAAVAASLGALTGTVDRSASAEAKSLFSSVDSHDNVTTYSFPGGITISEEQAKTMTLADLARQLNGLNLTTEMPA